MNDTPTPPPVTLDAAALRKQVAAYIQCPCSSGHDQMKVPLAVGVVRALLDQLDAAWEPIKDTYSCGRCGRRDGLDAVAPTDVWAALTGGRILGPAGEVGDAQWSILCLWCMDERAAELGIACSVSLHFAGRALTGTSQSDADRAHIVRLTAERDVAIIRAVTAEQTAVRIIEDVRRQTARAEKAERALMVTNGEAYRVWEQAEANAARAESAEREVAKWRRQFDDYGDHANWCGLAIEDSEEEECICGYAALDAPRDPEAG